MDFYEQLNYYTEIINNRLNQLWKNNECLQRSVYDAMQYSLLAGGKRIRPVLTLAAADLIGGDREDALLFATAIECIHTYSLIHDDLPCMDNDDMRRGRPTCHKKFDEATALLAGDGLLTFAFEYMTDFSKYNKTSAEAVLKIISEVAKGAGCNGMIGGQIVDLESENQSGVSEETLTYMHRRKTGELIRISLFAGAVSAGATEKQIKDLEEFADKIGLAFQIQDDILDFTSSEDVLGKPIGSDAENNKTTYVTLLGIDKACKKAEKLTDDAVLAIERFGEQAWFLKELAYFLINREN